MLRGSLLRAERMQRMTTVEARKKDAREKIELGGLIVKAGLRYEKRALLLGLLIDAGLRIKADEGERSRLTEIGAKAFTDDA
ncbi:conjugal transfer protein TraD (plasmid) [Agrobacterium tumefaciens F2]|nr:conjugal transfer protein TraD [Agrobacterium tumefaciens F2]